MKRETDLEYFTRLSEQHIRVALVQLEKIMFQGEPWTVKEIAAHCMIQKRILKKALHTHPKVKKTKRGYVMTLKANHPVRLHSGRMVEIGLAVAKGKKR